MKKRSHFQSLGSFPKLPFRLTFSVGAVLFTLAVYLGVGRAQTTGLVHVESRVDKSMITIGDLVHYEVIISYAPRVKLTWPGIASNLGAFEIRDYDLGQPNEETDLVTQKISYTISTFDTGAFVIPPIAFQYTIPPDNTVNTLQTEAIPIYVKSILPSQAGDIKGLKPQAELPRNWRQIIIYGVAGLLLVALVVLLILYFRARRKGEGLFTRAVPPRPAHEIALEALAELEGKKLMEKGEVKEHFFLLSEIVRAYLAGRYFVPALELTTFEIMQHFASDGQLGENQPQLVEILDLCDLAKFAKYVPNPEQSAAVLKNAYGFVEATKLVYESEKPETETLEAAEAPATTTQPANEPEPSKEEAATV